MGGGEAPAEPDSPCCTRLNRSFVLPASSCEGLELMTSRMPPSNSLCGQGENTETSSGESVGNVNEVSCSCDVEVERRGTRTESKTIHPGVMNHNRINGQSVCSKVSSYIDGPIGSRRLVSGVPSPRGRGERTPPRFLPDCLVLLRCFLILARIRFMFKSYFKDRE